MIDSLKKFFSHTNGDNNMIDEAVETTEDVVEETVMEEMTGEMMAEAPVEVAPPPALMPDVVMPVEPAPSIDEMLVAGSQGVQSALNGLRSAQASVPASQDALSVAQRMAEQASGNVATATADARNAIDEQIGLLQELKAQL